MITEGTFPFPRDEVALEGPPGRRRRHPARRPARIRFASPTRRPLHRLGIHAYTPGLLLGDIGFEADTVAVPPASR